VLLQYSFGLYFDKRRATITIERNFALRVRSLESAFMYGAAINKLIPQRLISVQLLVHNERSFDIDQCMFPKHVAKERKLFDLRFWLG
jgi:hypothetical protein